MSRVYATEEGTGRRFLARIECDYCDASIKPHPNIAQSGWKRWGTGPGFPLRAGDYDEFDCCPDHTHKIPDGVIEDSEDYMRWLKYEYPHLYAMTEGKGQDEKNG